MTIICGDINDKYVFHFVFLPRYEYMLGEQTWIEYWPTDLECQEDLKYGPTCEGIEELLYTFSTTGCKQ